VPPRLAAWRHRPPLPLRRQKLPELVHPQGHVPTGLEGLGTGKGSASAAAAINSSRAALAVIAFHRPWFASRGGFFKRREIERNLRVGTLLGL
jgi:hypothetical protein